MDDLQHSFEPPEADLELKGNTGKAITWSVYSTFCKRFGPEKKADADRKIMDVIIRAQQRKLLKEK